MWSMWRVRSGMHFIWPALKTFETFLSQMEVQMLQVECCFFIEHQIKQTSFTFINKVIHTIYYIFYSLFLYLYFIFHNRCGNFKRRDKNVFFSLKKSKWRKWIFPQKRALKCTPNALIKRHQKIFKCRKATQKKKFAINATHTSVVKYFYSYLKWCNWNWSSMKKVYIDIAKIIWP